MKSTIGAVKFSNTVQLSPFECNYPITATGSIVSLDQVDEKYVDLLLTNFLSHITTKSHILRENARLLITRK
jgi:hypothetical protein